MSTERQNITFQNQQHIQQSHANVADKANVISELKTRISQLELALQQKDTEIKQKHELYLQRQKDASNEIKLLNNKNKRLTDEQQELIQDVKQANVELESLRRQVTSLQNTAITREAWKELGEKNIAKAKLYAALCDMPFLSGDNRTGLSTWLNTLDNKEECQQTLITLQNISTLLLNAKTNFENYNKHYIAYVEGLKWWQRILYNHGRSGIYRAMRSNQLMVEQFEAIQQAYNEQLSTKANVQKLGNLYMDIKKQLITAAEKQLVEIRSNYFDSSNLNPNSYATYLIQYISDLKTQIPEQNDVAISNRQNACYQPVFAKEAIKPLYEQFKNEYETTINMKI